MTEASKDTTRAINVVNMIIDHHAPAVKPFTVEHLSMGTF